MELRSALYYPHTKMHSATLLKRSLLLWDKIEFITPEQTYRPTYGRSASRAIELIGTFRHPSDTEKKQAHDDIMEVLTRGNLPGELFHDEMEYAVYPEKFDAETWSMLHQLGLLGTPRLEPGHRYPVAEPIGLLLMSILADACAGETRARITDRRMAYAKLTGLLVDGQYWEAHSQVPHEAVVPLTLNLINASSLRLDDLVRFREREERETGGHTLRALRHRYVERIAQHVRSISERGARASDREELDRCFEEEMKADLLNLQQEIRHTRTEHLFSASVVTTAVVAAAAVGVVAGIPMEPVLKSLTMLPGAVAVGGLFAANSKYATARKSLIQKHPMAYMYELEQSH